MTDHPLPPVQPDDTQPVATVTASTLTDAQRQVLLKASLFKPYFSSSALVLGSNHLVCDTLVDLGLLTEPVPGRFAITPAGRAAIAPQPGDGLPESPDVDRDTGVGSLVRDGSLFAESLDPGKVDLMDAIASDVNVALLADKAALLEELEDARRVNERLVHDLADARGSMLLKQDLYDRVQKSNSNLMTANRNLSETLDRVRRDKTALEARLQLTPPPDVLTLLETLTKRVDELEALVDEPVPYVLADTVERVTRVEVRTLRQNLNEAVTFEENELAQALNDGWEIVPSLSRVGRNDYEAYGLPDQVYWRIVTLTREVVEPVAGDDADAEAEQPAAVPPVDLIPVVDHALAAPGQVVAYANHAPMVVSVQPLISLQV